MNKKFKYLAAMLSVGVLAGGCGTQATDSSDGGEATQIRFRQEWVPNGMYAPFYLGVANGTFAKQDLDLKMLKGNGSLAAIDEVAAGKADYGMASCASLALAIGNGRDITSIAQYTGKYSWGFYIPADSSATSIADLKGKTVVMSPASSEAALLPAVLEKAGLSRDGMKNLAVDPSQKVSTYGRSQGDSLVTTVAYGEPLVQAVRASKVLLWADAGFVMPDYCLFAQQKTVTEKSEQTQKFLDAAYASMKAAADDPDAAVAAAMKFDPLLKKADTAAQWKETQRFFFTDETKDCSHGWHSQSDWDAGLKTLRDFADLKGDQPTSEFFTNNFFKCDK